MTHDALSKQAEFSGKAENYLIYFLSLFLFFLFFACSHWRYLIMPWMLFTRQYIEAPTPPSSPALDNDPN